MESEYTADLKSAALRIAGSSPASRTNLEKIMSEPSTSPERNTFQKQNYILRTLEEGKSLDDPQVAATIELYESWTRLDNENLQDPEWQQHNLEWDLRTTDWILEKTRVSKTYAQNLYAALCNNDFIELDVMQVLRGETWSCSWRSAGGIVANMRGEGDYIDWYCSGIVDDDDKLTAGSHVSESVVTDEIREDLRKLGWAVITNN